MSGPVRSHLGFLVVILCSTLIARLASLNYLQNVHSLTTAATKGNKPPFTNKFKAKYSSFDTPRSAKYFGVPYAPAPDFFPILSILPQRCMIYVKDHYPQETFEQTVLQLWVHLFNKATDISRPEHLSQALAEHIDAKDVPTILAAADTPKYKQALTDNTQKAMDRGAFGAPWLWVSNRHGESQPFFGADRFHLVWQFLDIPFSDLAIKEKPKL